VVVFSDRPGRVLAKIDIDLPRPRDTDLIGTEPFNQAQSEIWELIRDASEELSTPE
jgi:NitT/TauT family transport system ATP-binding protein